jgi:hypothetical protein
MKKSLIIIPPETVKLSLVYRNSSKRELPGIIKHLGTVLMVIFLLMIIAPANAATDSGKGKNSKCRASQTIYSYPIVTKKKNKRMSYKKHRKISRAKRMPFLV